MFSFVFKNFKLKIFVILFLYCLCLMGKIPPHIFELYDFN